MRSIFPDGPSDTVDLAGIYAYPDRPWLRVNMVASADGGAWLKGLSKGLSSPGDQRVFSLLRGLADVIVAGARTVRIEGYGPARPRESWKALRMGRPAAPPIAVITRRLDLDLGGPLFTTLDHPSRTIVITCESAPRDRREEAAKLADVVIAGDDRVDMAEAIAALHARGLTRILCEGGSRLNGQLAAAGLIDELCLTISPILIGGDAARVLNGPSCDVPLRLAHVLEEDGFLFTRYVRAVS